MNTNITPQEAQRLLDGMKTVHFVRYERSGGRTPARPHRMTYTEETKPMELQEAQKYAERFNSIDGGAGNARVITQYILETGEPNND